MTVELTIVLPAELSTPKVARDAVAARFGSEPRCGDLLLCISEVVTNAVRHARSASLLTVWRRQDIVTVEVSDASLELPVGRIPSIMATTGRGLFILDRLATSWGARHTAGGKVVWFEFDLAGASP